MTAGKPACRLNSPGSLRAMPTLQVAGFSEAGNGIVAEILLGSKSTWLITQLLFLAPETTL